MAAILLGIIFLAMSTHEKGRKESLIYWLLEGTMAAILLAAAAWWRKKCTKRPAAGISGGWEDYVCLLS